MTQLNFSSFGLNGHSDRTAHSSQSQCNKLFLLPHYAATFVDPYANCETWCKVVFVKSCTCSFKTDNFLLITKSLGSAAQWPERQICNRKSVRWELRALRCMWHGREKPAVGLKSGLWAQAMACIHGNKMSDACRPHRQFANSQTLRLSYVRWVGLNKNSSVFLQLLRSWQQNTSLFYKSNCWTSFVFIFFHNKHKEISR